MRLTTVIILLAIMQVSASSYAQKLNYVKKNVPLLQFFKEIKKQTGYNVVWNEEKLDVTNLIDVNFKNAELEDALTVVLKKFPLTYTISKKTIILKEKEPSFLDKVIDHFSTINVRGRVTDSEGNPLIGATVKVKGTNILTVTGDNGKFNLDNLDSKVMLVISYLGYETTEIIASENIGNIVLVSSAGSLNEVEVVSTGYQDIPKERATGSFTIVDNKTINRGVGVNILDRLESVTSGLLVNRGLSSTLPLANNPKISIHGRSTIFSNAEPLIVLNGFPYDGAINQINPSDIESINILKDAAAASIWGVRSGNGVIVITTKSGHKNQALIISGSSTLTMSKKPNQRYLAQISPSDFIDLEQYLFKNGLYNFSFFTPYNGVSTAIEIFNQSKLNNITKTDSAVMINQLKSQDVRSDIERYINRSKIQQQYQLNLRGGTETHTYYMSGGYDKNIEDKVYNNNDRITFNANNTFSLLKERIILSTDLSFVSSNNNTAPEYLPYSPYDRIADNSGRSLPVMFRGGFRMSYLDTAGNGNLLDWHYRPKDELSSNSHMRTNQYKLKFGLNYKLIEGFIITANYQYLNETSVTDINDDTTRYLTRNLINQYSSIHGDIVDRVIPLGSIYSILDNKIKSNIFRTQLNYSKLLSQDHEINAIIGYENSDTRTNNQSQIYYGYDPETLLNSNGLINPLNNYKLYYGPATGKIATAPNLLGLTNINQSYYGNFSYSFKRRYVLSGSIRRDESNLFGVKTNQKGVPLWSSGIAWNIDKEDFFKLNWLPLLKFRITYGHNGNVDRSISALLTARTNSEFISFLGNQYASIQNPPNPSLRWEIIKTWNFGLDFALKSNRISGSIDAYQKKSIDLIGNNPIAPQSGITQFRGNGASMRTKGIDLLLNSNNLTGKIKWESSILFNYNMDKVIVYKVKQPSNLSIVSSNYDNPLVGKPYNSIFSFPSAGLDATGAPQGILNGVVSKDYAAIITSSNKDEIKFHGSASPKYFGSLINTVKYKTIEISFNIVYKFNYFFRRSNVFSGSNYGFASSTNYNLGDYEKRWQKPGDEKTTKIPALIYPSNFAQNSFFQYSEDLVERGDHIRLQDIRCSYNLLNKDISPFKNINIFLYTKNIGIIWRKNKLGIDPDYGTNIIPEPFSCSLGINFSL